MAGKDQIIPTWKASFENCIFKGSYEARFSGCVTDCDFSDAILTIASFQQESPLGDVEWPKYPHIVITDAQSHYSDWKSIEKPKEFNQFAYHPKTKSQLIVINLAKAVHDPEDFWELIKDKRYVSMTR